MIFPGITECFPVLNSGENAANLKPASDTFMDIEQKLGMMPQEYLAVKDAINGCLAAKNA